MWNRIEPSVNTYISGLFDEILEHETYTMLSMPDIDDGVDYIMTKLLGRVDQVGNEAFSAILGEDTRDSSNCSDEVTEPNQFEELLVFLYSGKMMLPLSDLTKPAFQIGCALLTSVWAYCLRNRLNYDVIEVEEELVEVLPDILFDKTNTPTYVLMLQRVFNADYLMANGLKLSHSSVEALSVARRNFQ